MRIAWVAYDSLHRILSRKTLILSLAIIIGIVFLALAVSNYLTTAGPAWHDLFRKHIFKDFLGSLYLLSQMLLTPFVIIIIALTAKDMYRGKGEHIYLTGGLSKPTAFIGRTFGLLLYIFLLWWGLFLLAGAAVLITGLGNISLPMVDVLFKLFVNSAAVSLLVCFLVGLSKTVAVGAAPILIYHYWLLTNSNVTGETAGSTLHNVINYLLPFNTFSQFSGLDTEHLDQLIQYKDLAPWHGPGWLIAFILIFFLASLASYILVQDQ